MHLSLKSLGIFVNVISISGSDMIFQQMTLGTTVIHHFRVILTGQSISDIIYMTLGHFQEGKSKGKFQSQTRNMRRPNTSFS